MTIIVSFAPRRMRYLTLASVECLRSLRRHASADSSLDLISLSTRAAQLRLDAVVSLLPALTSISVWDHDLCVELPTSIRRAHPFARRTPHRSLPPARSGRSANRLDLICHISRAFTSTSPVPFGRTPKTPGATSGGFVARNSPTLTSLKLDLFGLSTLLLPSGLPPPWNAKPDDLLLFRSFWASRSVGTRFEIALP